MNPALAAIALAAAVVNGALGYGFSSITVPLALLFLSNRALNPAIVLIEVAVNAHTLWTSRASASAVWPRVARLAAGIVPGVLLGSLVLSRVSPEWLRFGTYAVLLPLILLQAAGVRRPLAAERALALPLGAAVGALYSTTTISGPPLALILSNQGLAKRDFRAALGLVRIVESALTAAAYAWAGLYTAQSARLAVSILPSVLVGVPLGSHLIRKIDAEKFRRWCMSFDAGVVAFGLLKSWPLLPR